MLDEGVTAPDHPEKVTATGVTHRGRFEGETIVDRLAQEVHDTSAEADLADNPSEGYANPEQEHSSSSPGDEFLS